MTGTTEMNPEEYSKLQKIFDECVDATEEERQSILDRVGEENPYLREEVEALLKHAAFTLGVPNDVSPLVPGTEPDDIDKDDLIGTTIRSYRIVRHLGSGGMGRVYEAEQEHPKRLVALKVLRRDLFSKSVQRRFEQECQILAKLSHRGIAHVIESGTFEKDGREYPFYTMELVPDAQTVLEYAETRKLDTVGRLRLMIDRTAAPDDRCVRSRSPRPISTASCTATSSRPTSSSTRQVSRKSSTSGWLVSPTPTSR